jgi:hypothetical protein
MAAAFFRFAFFFLIAFAMLGVLTMGITVIVLGLKAAWLLTKTTGEDS